MELDNQHYNMAAMLARYWNYETSDSNNNRKKLIAVFDINKFFQSEDVNFFVKIKDQNYLKKKIKDAISSEDPKNQKNNKRADAIFTSLLISKETEKILKVYDIENSFLKLLEKSDAFKIDISNNMDIVRNFATLQIVRSPIKYKFILDSYFNQNIGLAISNKDDSLIPNLFNTFSLLDFTRIEDFVNFGNQQIIDLFNNFQNQMNRFIFYPIEIESNFIGDLTASFLNLKAFGLKEKQIKSNFPIYLNNEKYFTNSLFIPITNKKILIGVHEKLVSSSVEKERHENLIIDLFNNNFMNQIQIIYSRYIAFPPEDTELFKINIFNFLNINDLEYVFLAREHNIGYLNNLEYLLEKFENFKSRKIKSYILDKYS